MGRHNATTWFLIMAAIPAISFSALRSRTISFSADSTTTYPDSLAPPYTHKNDVVIGTPKELPSDGWYAFTYANKRGLYISPLDTFDPVPVPNTENDQPLSVDISDDGCWITYYQAHGNDAVLISADGKKKVIMPAYVSGGIGFYRGSPNGNELFFNDGSIQAIRLYLDTVPSFGAQRTLFMSVPAWHDQWGIWKDQIFGLLENYDPLSWEPSYRTGFIVLPDSGKGTASDSNVFKWVNDSMKTLWECGHTMSHDGQLCLANSNGIGGPWVPNTHQTPYMDHKGFYITKFWREGVDTPITIDEQIDKYGISINWCPEKYRIGLYNEVNFTDWSFSNDNEYVIGILTGTLSPVWGIWVVHWKTNTWTLVTPETKSDDFKGPALYFTSKSPVTKPVLRKTKRIYLPSSILQIIPGDTFRNRYVPGKGNAVAAYSIDGRRCAVGKSGRKTHHYGVRILSIINRPQ